MKTKTTLPQLKKYYSIFFSFILMLSTFSLKAQLQIGSDIDGEAAGDNSGRSVSMPDAYTVAIGAPFNDGNGSMSGHVRIYTLSNNVWIQKGLDIDGEAAGDFSGFVVNMPDSNTLAIGAPPNRNGNGSKSGHVRIYRWNGNAWVQKGNDIDGEAAYDGSGNSVSMADSNTVAIGASGNDGSGNGSGHVRVYRWNGSAWVQKGIDIDGEAGGDASGWSVSMSDSNTVAIGAPSNSGLGTRSGHVRIYRWIDTAWVQKGIDIDGEAIYDRSGISVSMPDSNTVAIGAPQNSNYRGHVRVYRWRDTVWVQKGVDIDGETADDEFGFYVSMPDSNTLAIGAIKNDGNGTDAGHVRVFKWVSSSWVQRGIDMDGEASGDSSGWSVNMPDTNTVAIGARFNDGNGTDAGHIRVYSLCNGSIDTSITLSTNTIIANDSTANYQWVNCDSAYAIVNGATNRSFTPPSTGNYSVIISRSHCVDTTACYNVVISGLSKQNIKQEKITVYPNPTKGVFTIESDAVNTNSPFEVQDITGKVVHKGKLNGNQTSVDLSSHKSGIYLLRVGDKGIKIIRR